MKKPANSPVRFQYPLWMTHDERAEQLGIASSTLSARIANGKHPPLVDGRFYGPSMQARDEAKAGLTVALAARQTVEKAHQSAPREPQVIEADHVALATAAARCIIKTGKPPSDQPYWANMRHCDGTVPEDIRKVFHLVPNADFGDVYAAIVRDKSQVAGRKMIEIDKAEKAKAAANHEPFYVRQFREDEEARKAQRAADRKALKEKGI